MEFLSIALISNSARVTLVEKLFFFFYRTKLPGAYPEPPPSYDMAMAGFAPVEEGAQPPAPQYTAGNDDAPLLPPYEEAVQQGRENGSPSNPPSGGPQQV